MIESLDIFKSERIKKEYELFQAYPRFNVYNVYKVNSKTNERIFLYRTTIQRNDYGKKLKTRSELLTELNKRLVNYC